MGPVQKRPSLKVLLVVYFLCVAVLPLVVFGGFSLRYANTQINQEIIEKKLYLAQSIACRVDSIIEEWMKLLEFANAQHLSRLNKNTMELLSSLITVHSFLETIRFVGKDQNLEFSLPFGIQGTCSHFHDKISYKGRKFLISSPFRSSVSNEILICMGLEGDKGTIYFYINMLQIQEALAKAVTESGAMCLMIDSENNIIAHPHRGRLLTQLQMEITKDKRSLPANAEHFFSRQEGESLFVVSKGLDRIHWKVLAVAPESEVFLASRFLKRFSILGLSAAAIFAFFLGWYVLRNIMRPVGLLIDGSKCIANGSYDLPELDAPYEEINELSRHVKDMAQAISSREAQILDAQESYRSLYEESRRREELYQSLLDTSADPIVIYDMEGRVKYLNQAFEETFGWTFEELKDKRIPFVPEDQAEATFKCIDCLLKAREKIRAFETKRYTKDGRTLDISISASVYLDHTGQPGGMLVILRDVTESKKLLTHFLAVQRMQSVGTLAGGIAHNFNNILMGIQGNASLMAMEIDKSSPLNARIKKIQELVKKGAGLTGQLLGFARGGRYQPRPLDLNQIIERNAMIFKETKEGFQIHKRLYKGPLYVEADESQLEQVIVNILMNAYQAMPQGGDIFIDSALTHVSEDPTKDYEIRPGAYAKVSITDTGVGMDQEVLKRIFEPFFTTRQVGEGVGLGLSAAYGIIKNHGGFIEVKSEPGKGSSFDIYLPLISKDKVNGGEEYANNQSI